VAPPTLAPAPPAASAEEIAAAPAPASEEAPPAPTDGAQVWQALLREAERANRPFWNVLRAHGSLASWDAVARTATVTLDDPGHEFFVRSKTDLLARLVQQVAGPGARIEVSSAPAAAKPQGGPKESDRTRNAKREAMEHPLVRDAMEIFDGDVEEVRVVKP